MWRSGVLLWLMIAAPALADDPDSAGKVAAAMAGWKRACERGDAEKCAAMARLADSDYTVLANHFHHPSDAATARWAGQRVIALLDEKCTGGDAKACDRIAGIYRSQAFENRPKRLEYMEKACAAGSGWSCFDRGQVNGRSKRATVRWYVEACRLGEKSGCRDLSMMVLSSLVLDPAEGAPVDGNALRKMLEGLAQADELPQATQQRGLALAVARLWSGERRGALDEIAAADAKVTEEEKFLHLFATYAELVAADGIDKPRAQRAWQRLVSLVPKRDGRYRDQQLESDFAFADPTAAMDRAEQIAARNR